jgi:hypothetical protein
LKIFIDANLLIYLNVLKSPKLREAYENFYLNLLSDYKAYLDVLILDELIYISKKKYNTPYQTTLEFIESIVLPYVDILPLAEKEYKKTAEILKNYKIKPSDALHIAVMTLNGISKIASEDKEIEVVKGIKRIWLTT